MKSNAVEHEGDNLPLPDDLNKKGYGMQKQDDGISSHLLSLLKRFHEGDTEAYEELYYRLSAPILKLLLRLLPSSEDAEDAMQDIFINLWNNREKIDVSRDISPLLYLMARQATASYYRKARVRKEYLAGNIFDMEVTHDSLDEVIAKEIELHMRMIVEKMPEPRREIYRLRFDKALSNSEIAHTLGITPETVKKQLHLARKQIRDGVSLMLIALLLRF